MSTMTVIATEMLDLVSGGSYSYNITVDKNGLSTDTYTINGQTKTVTYQIPAGTTYVPGTYSYSYGV